MLSHLKKFFHTATPFFASGALIVVFFMHISGTMVYRDTVLGSILIIFSIPIWIEIIVSMIKGRFGIDLIAGLALGASVIFHQYLPGVIVLLMLSGGEALESYAMRRARTSLRELLALMPDVAHVKTPDGVRDLDSHEVHIGMHIIVKPGEVIPVDGVVEEGESFVDESIMTGESIPREKKNGSPVLAGTTNTTAVLEIRTTKILSESRLEGIVAMVRKAEEEKAPFVRLADRYSVYFTLFTVFVALLAWAISGEASRILAVLVVATPCPLILATPIAFMSGMSVASKRGIIVKNGGALELLDRAKTFVFDKTGTITLGVPKIHRVISFSSYSEEDVLMRASSLDQLSVHILARALLDFVRTEKKGSLSYPENFKEQFGDGVTGDIDGVRYIFGKLSYLRSLSIPIPENVLQMHTTDSGQGIIAVYLASENELLGVVLFQDEIRPDISTLFSRLKQNGISRMILLSGDKENVARQISTIIGIKEYKAECLPDEKLAFIQNIQNTDHQYVAMVGDGINDAPALTQADVGIALGSHGATAASDSADIVILSGTVGLVSDAHIIAKRSLRVAREGIWIGIGLSSVCMVIALFGYLPPFYGALIQEAIDVAVILYALRAGTVAKGSHS